MLQFKTSNSSSEFIYLVWTEASHAETAFGRDVVDCSQKKDTITVCINIKAPQYTEYHLCLRRNIVLLLWAVITVPDDIFTERKKRLFLVMSKHFKHNGLSLDVVNERFSNFNSNLQKQRSDV